MLQPRPLLLLLLLLPPLRWVGFHKLSQRCLNLHYANQFSISHTDCNLWTLISYCVGGARVDAGRVQSVDPSRAHHNSDLRFYWASLQNSGDEKGHAVSEPGEFPLFVGRRANCFRMRSTLKYTVNTHTQMITQTHTLCFNGNRCQHRLTIIVYCTFSWFAHKSV